MMLTTLGWWSLLAAILGEVLVPLLLAPCFKGYSHSRMVISSLGSPASPVRRGFNLWMLAAGALLLLSLPALYGAYRPVSGPLAAACCILLAIFAVGACICSCFFSVNDSRAEVTAASKVHGAGSAVGFMALLAVPLLLAILEARMDHVAACVIFALLFGLSLAAFVLFVLGDKPVAKGTLLDRVGLWQRVNLYLMYAPLAVIAIRNLSVLFG